MSILNILQLLIQKPAPASYGELTCPNCGKKQPPQEGEAEKRFSCLYCHFKVPLLKSVPPSLARNPSLAKEVSCIVVGVLSACLGLKGFLIPNGLIDGGITGVSMLCAKVLNLPLAGFIVLINIPFIIAAHRYFNREFALRSAVSIGLLALALPFVPVPAITSDRLLDAVFGGFFLGSGIALSIRGGGVLDGTEILALLISKHFPATVGDAILFFNILIFSVALAFIHPEQVLYSVLTYFAASKTVDFMMHGIESVNGVLIISPRSSQIRFAVVNRLERGITLLKAKGGYSEKDQEILFCVLTRLEIRKMQNIVDEFDPNAFVIIFPISDVRGGMVKKVLHEKQITEQNHQV